MPAKRHLLTTASIAVLCISSALSANADDAVSLSLPGTVTDATATPDSTNHNTVFVQMSGPLDPAYGSIDPFFGNIHPFFGNIHPFWGNVDPFWGNLHPFSGDLSSFWGNLNPFYGNIHPFWGVIQPFWDSVAPLYDTMNGLASSLGKPTEANKLQYGQLKLMLQNFYNQSSTTWGAQVQAATRKNFRDGFAHDLMDEYHVDFNKPETFTALSAADRSRFFMEWYDGLMQFSGMDHVDHWMATVNWSPALTQDQGSGAGAIVGVLDTQITGDADLKNNLIYTGGYAANGKVLDPTKPPPKPAPNDADHGAAVASLILGAQDGTGVMGVAPDAQLALYNPFDGTQTASWADARKGIVALSQHGAEVINLSLGVSGFTLNQGLLDIISDPTLQLQNTMFVVAAGNSGVAQSSDVIWRAGSPNNLVIVGSVAIDQTLSSFSNAPGEACITVGGTCAETDKLKYHFLVAPGELLLVSDNAGGVTRVSGTSFAAPLVTGAIALLDSRWPWLRNYTAETSQIIFQSAKDLGAPGVDAVYGWGLLDIQASQSPLNFNNLVVYQGTSQLAPSALKAAVLSPTTRGTWEATGGSLYALEYIGGTYRDFTIPLSSLLYGKTTTQGGRTQQYQRYMYQRLVDWANKSSLSDIDSTAISAGEVDGWNVGFISTPADPYSDTYDPELPFQGGYVFSNEDLGVRLQMGLGQASTAAFLHEGFGFQSDYDAASGGVNPILGFASGDEYMTGSYNLSEQTTVTFGFTRYEAGETSVDPITNQLSQPVNGMDAYAASALVLDFAYRPADWLSLNATYTQLNEQTGLLGVQGAGALSLAGGAVTDSITLGSAVRLDRGLTLALSGTIAKTRAGSFSNSGLSVSDDGITSTAFEVALEQAGLFTGNDAMRISVTQPLHIESGSLDYTSMQVIDRQTGQLGAVTQDVPLSNGGRAFVGEVLYNLPVMDGKADVSLVGKVDFASSGSSAPDVTVGARFGFKF